MPSVTPKAAIVFSALMAAAAPAAAVSEIDFFTELPEVLSVSRLAQPLDEAPASVTVIDRDMIRLSGARTVADVLRLVPGFIVSTFEGAARPIVSYHADYDGIVRHLQVMVDGRSVYSSLLVGSATYGMLAVVPDDIERIEVLRGSNSAAYGANAFLGVVNIVTRHAADTKGGLLSVALGQGRVRDGTARLGWGADGAAYRLTAASRGDDGAAGYHDRNRIDQLHFRSDLQPSGNDDLMLAFGHADFTWGAQTQGGAARDEQWSDSYVRAQWMRRLNESDHVRFGATADRERYRDFFPLLRANGIGDRAELEAEHGLALAPAWRLVWGGQYRHERVQSADLFYGRGGQQFNLWRLFANAEWKPTPSWALNAGGLYESHSQIGDQVAPRLAVNYHLLPGQTVRLGNTVAYKAPTLFELHADWRQGTVPVVQAGGNARSERVNATEAGYLGEFRGLGLAVDLRVFREKVADLLRYQRPCPACANDLVNKDDSLQHGWETQLRWQASASSRFLFNHTGLRLRPAADSTAPQDAYRAPRHYSTLAWFQALPGGFDLSLIHSRMASYFYVRQSDMIPAYRRTDLRLARRLMIGNHHAEAALVVRAADGGYVDYVQRGFPALLVDRRAHLTLHLEF